MQNALAGGHLALPVDTRAAEKLRALYPGAGRLVLTALGFHAKTAQAAVTGTLGGTAAGGVVFAGAGLPGGGEPVYAAAARAAAGARFCFADPDYQVTAMRQAKTAAGDRGRVFAVTAPAADPGAVLQAAVAAGIPGGVPLSVHTVLSPLRWDADTAARVLARWRELLVPGSAVVLSLAAIAEGRRGDEILAALSSYGPRALRHDAGEVARWFAGARLRACWGPADVRAYGRAAWVRRRLAAQCPAARMLGAAAVVPG